MVERTEFINELKNIETRLRDLKAQLVRHAENNYKSSQSQKEIDINVQNLNVQTDKILELGLELLKSPKPENFLNFEAALEKPSSLHKNIVKNLKKMTASLAYEQAIKTLQNTAANASQPLEQCAQNLINHIQKAVGSSSQSYNQRLLALHTKAMNACSTFLEPPDRNIQAQDKISSNALSTIEKQYVEHPSPLMKRIGYTIAMIAGGVTFIAGIILANPIMIGAGVAILGIAAVRIKQLQQEKQGLDQIKSDFSEFKKKSNETLSGEDPLSETHSEDDTDLLTRNP